MCKKYIFSETIIDANAILQLTDNLTEIKNCTMFQTVNQILKAEKHKKHLMQQNEIRHKFTISISPATYLVHNHTLYPRHLFGVSLVNFIILSTPSTL